MNNHILIPVALDHEGLVARKIEVARHLLNAGGKITLVTVLENIPGFVSEFVTVKSVNNLTDKVQAKLEQAAAGAEDIQTKVLHGKPGVRIAEFAAAESVDLVIVGSHSPDGQGYALGSTAARVARRAPCSVFVVR